MLRNSIFNMFQDTDILLQQLEEDRQAAKEVEEIVSQEESIMAKEMKIVQDYADVSLVNFEK